MMKRRGEQVTEFGGQPHLLCDKASCNSDIFPGGENEVISISTVFEYLYPDDHILLSKRVNQRGSSAIAISTVAG